MGSMFGGGSDDSSSREMIQMQKDEAAEARKKETERQARITSGLARIKEAFHGRPEYKTVARNPYKVTAPTAGTASGAAVSGLPTGYKYVQMPGTPGAVIAPSAPGAPARQGPIPPNNDPNRVANGGSQRVSGNDGWGRGYSANRGPSTPRGPATPGKWVVQGPDGKYYEIGSDIGGLTEQKATGKTIGGIQSDFFNNFKQGILDFYQPQVAQKYADAQKETTYRLADAGTLRSSMANELAADLSKQNTLNTADVRSKADTAAADLRTRTAAEEAKAVSQLYATENPNVAASQATHAVTNLIAEKPTSTPLGDIFNIAAIGGAKFLQGADNAAFAKKVGALPKPAQRIV